MSKVVVLQSNYLPWKGYFHLVEMADRFIFYDDVQFTKNDWRNRNLVKSPKGPIWLSVPCGQKIHRLICEVQLSDHAWQMEHWAKIQSLYRSAPFFKHYEEFFRHFYCDFKWESLSEMNHFLIKEISRNIFGLKTEFDDSRNYNIQGVRGQRLYNLLKAVGATEYISGPSAKSYLDPKWFLENGIQLTYIDYSKYPEYAQLYPPFTHQVSVIDLLFQIGEKSHEFIWGA